MKQKIIDALTTKYANLGLSAKVFEGVADSAANFITTEEQIPAFVDNAKQMLTNYQSLGDKDRTAAAQAQKKVTELQAQLEAAQAELLKAGGEGKDKTGGDDSTKTADLIAKAVADALKPLSEEIATLKTAKTSEAATSAAHDVFFGNDYTKKYTEEASDAWDRAIEMYEATGKTLTADELSAKAMGYFSKAVTRKGVDTNQPFKADPSVDVDGTTDWKAEHARKVSQGKIADNK